MNDIKTKPSKTRPKILDKTRISQRAKALTKMRMFSQTKRLHQEEYNQQSDNAINQATDKVEDSMQTTAAKTHRAAGRAKTFAVKKLKQRRSHSIEQDTADLPFPQSCEQAQVHAPSSTPIIGNSRTAPTERKLPIKTREQYMQSQSKPSIYNRSTTPKTPEHTRGAVKPEPFAPQQHIQNRKALAKQRIQKYAMDKQHHEAGNAASQIPGSRANLPEQTPVFDNRINTKAVGRADGRIKTKKADIKSHDQRRSLPKESLRNRTTTLTSSKTQVKSELVSYDCKRRITKKANPAKTAQKKAVAAARKKTAQQAAKRTAQTTKAAVKTTVTLAVKVTKAIISAVKEFGSAIVALGGWGALLVVLIVIITVAALAASPFGVFLSDQAADSNSIPVSSIVAECSVELSARLDNIENSYLPDRVVLEGEQAAWSEVLAVFAVKIAGAEDGTAQDVVVIDESQKQKIKEVFWDMNCISHRVENTAEIVLYITLCPKTADEMAAQYNFTARQQEALATLLEHEDVLLAAAQSLAISDNTAKNVLDALPDGLAIQRKAVVKAACSLVGKVNYFWGGKSSAIGWDSEWGKMKIVSAEGSKTTGTKRPFGLDCSGFVTWTFINSGFNAAQIGHGTRAQLAACTRIAWENAQPGDLAFVSDLSHVGIVAGRDANGNILVIHCASGANNVVITTNAGFDFAARPWWIEPSTAIIDYK